MRVTIFDARIFGFEFRSEELHPLEKQRLKTWSFDKIAHIRKLFGRFSA